jgi:UDP-N-acetylmuramate dehydrogenase
VPSADIRVAPGEQVPLAPLSTLGVGGPARWFVRATTAADVAAAHQWSVDRGVPLFVLGGGSNIVVGDEGFDGLVLQVALTGVVIAESEEGSTVTAAAGEPWDPLVQSTVDRRLCGLECLSGIPGTVGGTPIQNVGAYGQEVAETIEQVAAYDRDRREMTMLTSTDCGFSYRGSRFKGADAGRFIVCGVTYRLRRDAPRPSYPDVLREMELAGLRNPSVGDVRHAVLNVRRRKGMVIDEADPDTRSVGSFFTNPVVTADDRERVAAAAGTDPPAFALPDGRVKLPAAWLIERAGFRRGESDGAAAISGKHTLALVNRGGATARDVLRLASRIKRHVAERFGVSLRPEPVFVGLEDDPDANFLRKT